MQGALSDNDVRLSVRPSVAIVKHMWGSYTKTLIRINVKIRVDYQMQCYDIIANPRWRTATNMKIVMSVIFNQIL